MVNLAEKSVYFPALEREIPVLKGVAAAENSTSLFLDLIKDLVSKLQDSLIFQIGTNQGAITCALGRLCKSVVAAEILHVSVDNTKLALSLEAKEVQDKVTIYEGDLALLEGFAKRHNTRCKYLFFNCPIFKGNGDVNLMAGEDFETPKRALSILSKVLDTNGEAFFLSTKAPTQSEEEKFWTVDKLREFLNIEMPNWLLEILDYRKSHNFQGEYLLVRVSRQKKGGNYECKTC